MSLVLHAVVRVIRNAWKVILSRVLPKSVSANSEETWRSASPQLFGGVGSFGNGAAMRVAPLGAFFADDLNQVVEQTRQPRSRTPTLKGSRAPLPFQSRRLCAGRREGPPLSRCEFLREVLAHAPRWQTHDGIDAALGLDESTDVLGAAEVLGKAPA